MRDLEGVLAVSLEQAVAAPLATSRRVGGGARVIKIERPEADFARGYDRPVRGESTYFVWITCGKVSISLDLRQVADPDLQKRMIERADAFVQNLAPGAAARLGVSPPIGFLPDIVDAGFAGIQRGFNVFVEAAAAFGQMVEDQREITLGFRRKFSPEHSGRGAFR